MVPLTENAPSAQDPRAMATGPRAAAARAPTGSGGLRMIFGRSLLPLVALVLILGTFLWGPWVTLVLTVAWWTAVTRWA